MPRDDQTLLARYARDRDEEAFGVLYERYAPLVGQSCERRLGRRADRAEDAAQAVFVLLARKAGRVSAARPLAAWLHRCAGNVCRHILREEDRRTRRERVAKERAMADPGDAERRADAAWDAMRPHVDAAIDELPASQREAVLLHFFAGKSFRDVAEELGRPTSTVQRRIESGVAKLRLLLSRRGVTVSGAALAAALAEHANAAGAVVSGSAAAVMESCAGAPHAGPAQVANGTLRMLTIGKAKLVVATCVVAAAACVGVGTALLPEVPQPPTAGPAPTTPSKPAPAQRRRSSPYPDRETGIPVPRRPNLRVVDYGGDMGIGIYRGRSPELLTKDPAVRVDIDGDGDPANDSVSGWAYDPATPLSPAGAYYDGEAPSARYYGGIIGHHAKRPRAKMTEGFLNTNHELRDDMNIMSAQDAATKKPGNFVRAWGVWYWQKEDFLSGGDAHLVRFDADSLIAVHISRYWDGIDVGRWVVRDGETFYVSEATFGEKAQVAARKDRGRHASWALYPTGTRWAVYEPQAPADIRFAAETARFASRAFVDVTAVGFYVAKDAKTAGVVSVKWNAFECFAVVERPAVAVALQPTVSLAVGAGGARVDVGTTEITYALWQRVYKWAVSNQYCFDLDQGGYAFLADGDMGSMDLCTGAHGAREPVTDIGWFDAVAWCNALSEYEGLEPCYYADAEHEEVLRAVTRRDHPDQAHWRPDVHWKTDAAGVRLLTLREWRAVAGRFDARGALHVGNAGGKTHAVGSLAAASRGIHDMWGNVGELVWDGETSSCEPGATHVSVGGDILCAANGTLYGLPIPHRPAHGSPVVGMRVARGTRPDLGGVPTDGLRAWTLVDRIVAANASRDGGGAAPAPVEWAAVRARVPSPVFVDVPAGKYARKDEATVTVSPFHMSRDEVSFGWWREVYDWAIQHGYEFDRDGDAGSMDWQVAAHERSPDQPVTDIGWFDARLWCNALSEMEGRRPCYYTDEEKKTVFRKALRWRMRMVPPASGDYFKRIHMGEVATDMQLFTAWDADGYRLPTRAEWEVAFRNGDQGLAPHELAPAARTDMMAREAFGLDAARAVDAGRPGGSGLRELMGNVAELLQDNPVVDYYRAHNPKGSEKAGLFGIVHGGTHFRDEPMALGQKPHGEVKSAGRPWIGMRVVRCDAGVHVDAPFEPKVVLDVDTGTYDRSRGPQHLQNALTRDGYAVGSAPRGAPKEIWRTELGGEVIAHPVLVDGTLFVGDRAGGVHAIGAADGARRWRATVPGPVTSGLTVHRGEVIVGTEVGWLVGLDVGDGRETWRWAKDPAAPRKHRIATAPTVAYDTIFVGVGRWHGHYSGLDRSTRKEVWRFRSVTPNSGRYAVTVVDDLVLFPGSDIAVVAADIRTELPRWRMGGHHCQTSMAVSDGVVCYSGGPGIDFYELATGKRLRRHHLKGEGLSFFPQSAPAFHDGRAFVAKDNVCVIAFSVDGRDVRELWEIPLKTVVRGGMVLTDDALVFGADDGRLWCLDPATGAERWRVDCGSPVAATPILDGGRLYVVDENGVLRCLR